MMFSFVVLNVLLSCFSLLICTCYGVPFDAYILNGNEASDAEYPWQLSFQRRENGGVWFHTCGAALINESYAVTASHCAYNAYELNENGTNSPYDVKDIRVVAGAHSLSPLDPDAEIHVIQSSIAPLGLNYAFDIALLKLEVAANTSRPDISTIELAADTDERTGLGCFVTGWGSVSGTDVKFTPILREASMALITHTDCRQPGWPVIRYQTCATGNPRQNTACFGDSGGPLSCTRDDGTPILVGISSFVSRNCKTDRPNVFARISIFRKWLRKHTKIVDI